MGDNSVSAPPPGALGKLAAMFDGMSKDAQNIVLVTNSISITPGQVTHAVDLQAQFGKIKGKYLDAIGNLVNDFSDFGNQLRLIEKSYTDTENNNTDDASRLQALVSKLGSRNAGVDTVMPQSTGFDANSATTTTSGNNNNNNNNNNNGTNSSSKG